jgi:hypothetical protein
MMGNADRAEFGAEAVKVGTPDYGVGSDFADRQTEAGDTIANVLHWLFAQGTGTMEERHADALAALSTAEMHFTAETVGGEA